MISYLDSKLSSVYGSKVQWFCRASGFRPSWAWKFSRLLAPWLHDVQLVEFRYFGVACARVWGLEFRGVQGLEGLGGTPRFGRTWWQ